MTNHYYTISEAGRFEIQAWLNRYHKNSNYQNLDAWVEAAETNMANNSPDCASVEISSFDSISGHVESLTIEGEGLTAHEIEG